MTSRSFGFASRRAVFECSRKKCGGFVVGACNVYSTVASYWTTRRFGSAPRDPASQEKSARARLSLSHRSSIFLHFRSQVSNRRSAGWPVIGARFRERGFRAGGHARLAGVPVTRDGVVRAGMGDAGGGVPRPPAWTWTDEHLGTDKRSGRRVGRASTCRASIAADAHAHARMIHPCAFLSERTVVLAGSTGFGRVPGEAAVGAARRAQSVPRHRPACRPRRTGWRDHRRASVRRLRARHGADFEAFARQAGAGGGRSGRRRAGLIPRMRSPSKRRMSSCTRRRRR